MSFGQLLSTAGACCHHSEKEWRREDFRLATVAIGSADGVKQLIEPDLDPIFRPDSYGYRPRKSALDAGWGHARAVLEDTIGCWSLT